MTHELAVWQFENCLGKLALVDGLLDISYTPGWLAQQDAVACPPRCLCRQARLAIVKRGPPLPAWMSSRVAPCSSNQHIQNVHQEDFCQAPGVVPEMKYQNEGGPDLARCFDLVRTVTRPSALQILTADGPLCRK